MTAGDVVVLRFPFSDLTESKLRPAVILADVGRDDYIACQVTSNRDADLAAIEITDKSFAAGQLQVASFVRPGKLFTAHRSVIAKRVAKLREQVRDEIRDAVIRILQHR